MNSRLRRSALLAMAVGAMVVASGCARTSSSTSPNGVSAQESADDFALQVATNLRSTGLEIGVATDVAVSLPCTVARTSVSRAQFDTTFESNGITFEVTRTFFGPTGNELPQYGPTAVRMVWTSRAYGTLSSETDTATVGHSGSLDVRGIEAARDTLDFDGLALDTLVNHFQSLDGSRERFFHATSALIYANVAMLKNRAVNPWPLSGTATYDLSADRLRSNNVTDVEAHLTAHVVVTFNGTDSPDVVVNGTYHYTINLLTGQVLRA
jgi:hypothetical protein